MAKDDELEGSQLELMAFYSICYDGTRKRHGGGITQRSE